MSPLLLLLLMMMMVVMVVVVVTVKPDAVDISHEDSVRQSDRQTDRQTDLGTIKVVYDNRGNSRTAQQHYC